MATATKKTRGKKTAAKKTETPKPSEGWLDNPNPEADEVQARAREKAAAKAKTTKKAPKKTTPAKKVVRDTGPEDDGEEHEGDVHNVVPQKYREVYKEHDGSCGDDVAKVFKDTCAESENLVATLTEIGQANGIDVMAKWGHLNNGMIRMNLGNVLRARVKNMKRVVIGSKVWKEAKA